MIITITIRIRIIIIIEARMTWRAFCGTAVVSRIMIIVTIKIRVIL